MLYFLDFEAHRKHLARRVVAVAWQSSPTEDGWKPGSFDGMLLSTAERALKHPVQHQDEAE